MWRLAAGPFVAVLVTGCGSSSAPGIDASPTEVSETEDPATGNAEDEDREDGGSDELIEPPEPTVAPECDDVDQLERHLSEDGEPTGTTAQPIQDGLLTDDGSTDAPADAAVQMASTIDAWAQHHASDSYGGLWVDDEIDGYVIAFTDDVDRYAEEIRAQVHPGLTVAEGDHTLAELNEIQDRVSQEEVGDRDDGPGTVIMVGTMLAHNRTSITIVDPDEDRRTELSETYGVSAICFSVVSGPQPPSDAVTVLAKGSGWRSGLHDEFFAMLEVAYDPEVAERAWDENVHDTTPRGDELPEEPGVYGGLADVDFDEQVVVVWSSGESGSCPEWIRDVDTIEQRVRITLDMRGFVCTDDYNAYRVVAAVDRDRLPGPDEIESSQIDAPDYLDMELRVYEAAASESDG